MDRVEFYVDGVKFATSTVPPYNKSWTIVMSDTVPKLGPDPVQVTLPYTLANGQVVERSVLSTSVWATRPITNPTALWERSSTRRRRSV